MPTKRATRARALPATIRVSVGEGAIELAADCALGAVADTIDALLREYTAALHRHAALRREVDTVPGGAVDVTEHSDWGDGRRRGIGFTAGPA